MDTQYPNEMTKTAFGHQLASHRDSLVTGEVDRAHEQSEHILKRLEELEARLYPVLRSLPEEATGSDRLPQIAASCEMAARVYSVNERLQMALIRLDTLERRIAL